MRIAETKGADRSAPGMLVMMMGPVMTVPFLRRASGNEHPQQPQADQASNEKPCIGIGVRITHTLEYEACESGNTSECVEHNMQQLPYVGDIAMLFRRIFVDKELSQVDDETDQAERDCEP